MATSGWIMPFIFIDQGAAAILQYHKPTDPAITRVSKGASIKKVEKKSDQHPRTPYQEQHHTSHQVHTAQDIMSSPVHTLNIESASIQSAWDILQAQHIKHLPITKNNKLVGLVSERDILKIYALKDSDKENWYHKKVYAASLNMDIHQLSRLMFDKHIGSLPIINDQQEIEGIVTITDILKLNSQYGPMEFWA